jgi:hypothetical protein
MAKKKVRRQGPLTSEQAALLLRARFVRSYLQHVEKLVEDLDEDAAKHVDRVSGLYHSTFRNHRAIPWLFFVRCIDHASRIAARHKTPASYNVLRAREARQMFRTTYPEYDAKLEEQRVVAAMCSWQKKRGQWVAIRRAVVDFLPNAPTARSMMSMWATFPHLMP